MSPWVLGWVYLIVFLVSLGLSMIRIALWHRQEAAYWFRVAELIRGDPKAEDYYRPLLVWTKANYPGAWGRLRKWRPPFERRNLSRGGSA